MIFSGLYACKACRGEQNMNAIINLYCSDSQMMNDSIDRILVELYIYKKKYGSKSLLMSGCGSRSGSTTIAINLAMALSMSGWKTLLVDCDLRKGIKIKRLNQKTDMGLSNYLSSEIDKEKVIYKTNQEFLEYIPSGTISNSPVHLFCSSKMEEFMKELKEEYEYIIFDFPSLNIVSDANILFPYVDGIALVAALNQTTKRQIIDAKRRVEAYKNKYYGLIVNQVQISQYKKYMKDYDYFGQQNLSKSYLANINKKIKRIKGDAYEKKDSTSS